MNYSILFNAPDPLSWWFIAIITLIFAAGALYGRDYLKAYSEHKRELCLHYFWYLLTFVSMIALTLAAQAVAFLIVWELMALGSFFLIIFESWNKDVIAAGINFFIQSHISVILLSVGFLIMHSKTGSFLFADWNSYNGNVALPFALVCCGFAIKAGFVPFHTWLPVAHPAAPAHISGVMSGVIIKIGIYGLLRSISIFNVNMIVAGSIILAVSVISGLYGVMMAIVQHNLKRLLAYHSIENIGIIGMGIGIGTLAMGAGYPALAALGFGGALLHTLNHALFKSTLFFTAGNIYQAAHTLNVEKMGGLLKKLPVTGLVFLVSAVAICGLPPMNGFVSEMMIYLGLFDMLSVGTDPAQFGIICSIVALVLIGGLAILCFTKALGVVFLGEPRSQLPEYHEYSHSRMFMPALLCVVMLSVGIYPELYIGWINRILPLFGTSHIAFSGTIATIGRISAVTIAVVALLWLVRKAATKERTIETGPTWGCGYTVESPKLQYTATSFVKSYSEIFGGMLKSGLLEKIAAYYLKFTGRFAFLQNGHLQFYILYGILFIVTTIILTVVIC